MSKQYTQAQKLAYYKKLARSNKGGYSIRGHGAYQTKRKPYRVSSNTNKNYRKRAAQNRSKGTNWGPVGSAVGGAVGSYFGPIGTAIGSAVGGLGGQVLNAISGHGAYKINANTVYQNSVPQFVSRMTDGCIRMRHKEFICDVVSSANAGAFKNESFKISASEPQTFPYLSQIAVNFEEFMFEGLVFSYVPSSGSISTTGQLGTVIMATQYNALSQPFTNKQQAEASTYSVSQVASQGCLHPIECDAAQTPSQGIFYTLRPSLSQANQDPRWQQLGQFNLMTQGMPNASENVGELYVTYDVVLCKPILIQDDGEQADHWTNNAAGAVTSSLYFGNSPTLSNFSDGFTSLGASTIFIDKSFNGNLSVSYGLHFTGGATGVDPLISAGVGATALNILDAGVTNQYVKTYDPAGTQVWTTAYFTITSTGVSSTLTLSGGTFGTVDAMDLIIEQLPADFD